jgi:hypothetical protein
MKMQSYLLKPKGATSKKFGKHWNRQFVRFNFGTFPPFPSEAGGYSFELMKCFLAEFEWIFENSKDVCSVW